MDQAVQAGHARSRNAFVARALLYDARLDPTEGSEQAGTRPVVIVSRDAINAASPVILVVLCTTYRAGRRLYPVRSSCVP